MLEDGEEIPQPTSLQEHVKNPEYEGFTFSFVDVDLTHLMGKAEKINVTLPSLLIKRIDNFVATHPEYKNRSNFWHRLLQISYLLHKNKSRYF